VLPPGHFAPYLNFDARFKVEADQLVDPKATNELRRLRVMAKGDGNWDTYDLVWATELERKLPIGATVLIVPADQIGQIMGGERIFAGQLKEEVWIGETTDQHKEIAKHRSCWQENKDNRATEFDTNEELITALKDAIDHWAVRVSAKSH